MLFWWCTFFQWVNHSTIGKIIFEREFLFSYRDFFSILLPFSCIMICFVCKRPFQIPYQYWSLLFAQKIIQSLLKVRKSWNYFFKYIDVSFKKWTNEFYFTKVDIFWEGHKIMALRRTKVKGTLFKILRPSQNIMNFNIKPQVDLFLIIFGGNWRHQKDIWKLSDF